MDQSLAKEDTYIANLLTNCNGRKQTLLNFVMRNNSFLTSKHFKIDHIKFLSQYRKDLFADTESMIEFVSFNPA